MNRNTKESGWVESGELSVRKSSRRAFSLIELLVVIALTTVLIGLLFGPLLQGFRFTNEAQNETEAQNAARVTMEQISREIGSAALVRDTSHNYLDMWMYADPSTGPKEVLARSYGAYMDIEPARPSEQGGTGHVADPTVNPGDPVFSLKPTNAIASAPSTTAKPIPLEVEAANPTGLPVAPASSIVRYWIGPRHPMNLNMTINGTGVPQPYIDSDEGQTLTRAQAAAFAGGVVPDVVANALDNTYILYRAQVPMIATVDNATAPATQTAAESTDYYQFFDTQVQPNGTTEPTLDDPDFFRIVTTNDVNPHAVIPGSDYSANEVTVHNNRVYRWYQAAHPILDVGNANLIFQTHDGRNNIVYNTAPGALNGYVAGTLEETDSNPAIVNPTSADGEWPILRTSVSFEPTTISNDSLSPTVSSDVSQGYGSNPSDLLTSYLPSDYKGQAGSWVGSPSVSISVPNGNGTPTTLNTYVYKGVAQTGYNPGDLIETDPSATAATNVFGNSTKDVYNVSQNIYIGAPPASATLPFVAMAVNGPLGNINFSRLNLPLTGVPTAGGTITPTAYNPAIGTGAAITGNADPTTITNPYWYITFNQSYGTQTAAGGSFPDGTSNTSGAAAGPLPLMIHLKSQANNTALTGYNIANDNILIPNPPLDPTNNLIPNIDSSIPAGSGQVVVNSERIYGPEQDAGPGSANPPAQVITTISQMPLVLYHRIPFNPGTVTSIGPDEYMMDYANGIVYLGSAGSGPTSGNINVNDADAQFRTVKISFSWQNNAGATNSTPAQMTGATARASYETGSKIAVSIGIRIFDPSVGHPSYFSLANAVTVGNASH